MGGWVGAGPGIVRGAELGGTGIFLGEYQGLGWAWGRVQGANDAGRRRGPHYLSVCPGENYKALEAPTDGFAPAFLWVSGRWE